MKIIEKNNTTITVQFEIQISKSMIKTEESIRTALNDCGNEITKEALSDFDTDGSSIEANGKRYSSKGKTQKKYQTPYGEINLDRHVYQSSEGGKTYCPLEKDARVFVGTTPIFAKQVSSKYSDLSAKRVQIDLKDNHARCISREYIRRISEAVGLFIDSKVDKWSYIPPIEKQHVKTIGIGLDGTCMYLSQDGWRLAMVGTIALYDSNCERLHTQYVASPPEYGKEKFYRLLETDIKNIKKYYPDAIYTGVADGAADNWTFLEKHTSNQTLDFFHASEYIGNVAKVVVRKKENRKTWFQECCHTLKHEKGGAVEVLNQLKGYSEKKYGAKNNKVIETAVKYFENHAHQMNYCDDVQNNLPIGSGVTEAGCKVIVKQRMCNSGMKWKDIGSKAILNLRCVNYSDGQWGQLWDKINKYGLQAH